MEKKLNYLEINKDSWNKRTPFHVDSEFYDLKGFLEGKSSLNDIELQLLGDIKGKKILHLQCHFGMDTISLGRLGAEVTGVDFSEAAIEKARELSVKTGIDAKFICCNVYDLPNLLEEKFDIVFSSYGAIVWLPDLDIWAKIISDFLNPAATFIFVEFHPVVWMFDDDFKQIDYSYFNKGPIHETTSGTYAERNAGINNEFVFWNHSLSDVINNLVKNKLELNSLDEYDYSPYNCFNKSIEADPKKVRIEHLGDKIPMVFAIKATKKKDL